jgi:hypothetical protein
MEDWIYSGHAIDFVLAVVAVEAAALLWLGKSSTRGSVLLALAPGVCLLLALRTGLTGGAPVAILFWLALAFPFHLLDLWRRFKD